MDTAYLQELIKEARQRDGGLLLNLEDKPAAVVLTVEKYNQLLHPDPENAPAMPVIVPAGRQAAPAAGESVLVTGGAGYIGAHLVHELIKAGYRVVVLDNLSSGRRENLHPEAVFVEGDLAEENLLSDLFAVHNITAVFHMAASLEVAESVREPEKYLWNNTLNTARLLRAMAAAGVRKLVFSSTAAVYGEAVQNPINETAPLHPANPYGASKLLAERLIKYYCEYAGCRAVVFRYFNACGFAADYRIRPTHESHLMYNVMQVVKGNRPHLEVFGNDYDTFDGTCVRDYVHVLDIVLPHILALRRLEEDGQPFSVYNIGTSRGSSVAEVANAASELLNKIVPMEVGPRRPGDPPVLVADNGKLLHELGYNLKYSSLDNMIKTSWAGMKDA
ncbi:MAG TPA: UDP-glucose 4-epimerase GalE [Patescibacteria group bacterium]|nr:UDP-glucose 4-epimerase GalE [Patescibacteria group bacterium]